MDTQRTGQFVAWTLVGTAVGALVSAIGMCCYGMQAMHQMQDPPMPHPIVLYLLAFAFYSALGVPPGFIGGFLMGLMVAPIPSCGQRLLPAALISAAVGFAYACALGTLFGDYPEARSFLISFGVSAGAVAGVVTTLCIEAISCAFRRP